MRTSRSPRRHSHRGSPALAAAFAGCLVAVGLCGCETTRTERVPAASDGIFPGAPEAPDAVPIVLGPVGGGPKTSDSGQRRRVDEDEAFWQEKFDLACAHEQAGEDETALALVAAAQRLDPPKPWDERFRLLKSSIKSRHLSVDVVRVDARGERDYVGFDEDVDFLIRVRNVGTTDLVIHGAGKGSGAGRPKPGEFETSAPTLALSIRRRDRDIYAAELVRSWTQTVPLLAPGEDELRIPPERDHEVRVRIPAEEAGGALSGVRVLEVSGDLRAARVEAGIEEPFGRIPIRSGRVVALPRNFEPLAADPLPSMRKAAAATAPVHLLVAAEFVPVRDRVAAVAFLAEVLGSGREELRPACLNALGLLRDAAAGTPLVPLGEPLMAAMRAHPERAEALGEGLSVLGGASIPPDLRLWEDWWRRQQTASARIAREDGTVGGARPDGKRTR